MSLWSSYPYLLMALCDRVGHFIRILIELWCTYSTFYFSKCYYKDVAFASCMYVYQSVPVNLVLGFAQKHIASALACAELAGIYMHNRLSMVYFRVCSVLNGVKDAQM